MVAGMSYWTIYIMPPQGKHLSQILGESEIIAYPQKMEQLCEYFYSTNLRGAKLKHPLSAMSNEHGTVCPGSSDPFHIVTYYIKLVNTSWAYSIVKIP